MLRSLLSPTRIGNLELPNRVVMAPMGVEIVDADGHAREPLAAYYEERYRERVLKGLRRRAKEFGYELSEIGVAEGVS